MALNCDVCNATDELKLCGLCEKLVFCSFEHYSMHCITCLQRTSLPKILVSNIVVIKKNGKRSLMTDKQPISNDYFDN